jgi:hypothetical protein
MREGGARCPSLLFMQCESVPSFCVSRPARGAKHRDRKCPITRVGWAFRKAPLQRPKRKPRQTGALGGASLVPNGGEPSK